FLVALPNIQADLHLNFFQLIGILQTVGIIVTLAALGAGWWGDRHRRVPMLAVGTILQGLAGLFSSQSRTRVAFGGGLTTDSIGGQLASIPSFSLLADWYPVSARGRVFALQGTLGR